MNDLLQVLVYLLAYGTAYVMAAVERRDTELARRDRACLETLAAAGDVTAATLLEQQDFSK